MSFSLSPLRCRLKIIITVENSVPSPRYQYVVHHPHVTVEDELMPGETPAEARGRISTIANALWAKELIEQLLFADRRASIGNEQWCQEYLSSIGGEDHAVLQKHVSPEALPPGVQATIRAFIDAAGSGLAERITAELKKILPQG